jgi:hypothetical protein
VIVNVELFRAWVGVWVEYWDEGVLLGKIIVVCFFCNYWQGAFRHGASASSDTTRE